MVRTLHRLAGDRAETEGDHKPLDHRRRKEDRYPSPVTTSVHTEAKTAAMEPLGRVVTGRD